MIARPCGEEGLRGKRERYGYDYEKYTIRDLCGDGNILYHIWGNGYTNQHIDKLE